MTSAIDLLLPACEPTDVQAIEEEHEESSSEESSSEESSGSSEEGSDSDSSSEEDSDSSSEEESDSSSSSEEEHEPEECKAHSEPEECKTRSEVQVVEPEEEHPITRLALSLEHRWKYPPFAEHADAELMGRISLDEISNGDRRLVTLQPGMDRTFRLVAWRLKAYYSQPLCSATKRLLSFDFSGLTADENELMRAFVKVADWTSGYRGEHKNITFDIVPGPPALLVYKKIPGALVQFMNRTSFMTYYNLLFYVRVRVDIFLQLTGTPADEWFATKKFRA